MSEKRKKIRVWMCEEIYLSSEWHERVKKGWGTFIFPKTGKGICIMWKPKDEGINGTPIQKKVDATSIAIQNPASSGTGSCNAV